MGPVMSPRVGLVAIDSESWPALPRTLGPLVVWDHWYPCLVGEHEAREYRDASGRARLFVVVRLALTPLGALVVVWVPSSERVGENTTFDLVTQHPAVAPAILAEWTVVAQADGTLAVPGLGTDPTEEADAARAAWPAGWRAWLDTDDRGTIDTPGTPTGGRILGCVLA